MRVLVIDDDEGVRAFARRSLERAGHSVQTMSDGRAVASAIGTELPDAVLTDIFMPEMDGFEVMLSLRRRSPETAIIAMTGGGVLTPSEALALAKHLNAREVLLKPFTARELLTVLARATGL